MVRCLERIILYNEGAGNLDIDEIAGYLRGKLGKVPVEIRAPFPVISPEERTGFARKLAATKVHDITRKMTLPGEPLYGEVEYEQRRILGKTKAFGVIYEGFQLQKSFAGLIPIGERRLNVVHIFFTNRLFATWEEGDSRYHARTSVYSCPSLISTSGLVEAPARPKEYYLLKQQYEMLGKDPLEAKDRFKGSFIDYDDGRLTEVAKGYAMQAVFFALEGSPFCQERGCRLYNAHWQEELIFAQLTSGSFCERHSRILNAYTKAAGEAGK